MGPPTSMVPMPSRSGAPIRTRTPGSGRRAAGSASVAGSAPPTAMPEAVSVMPYVVSTGIPSARAAARLAPVIAAPPSRMARRVEGTGRPCHAASSRSSCVGTSDRWLMPVSIRSTTSSGSKRAQDLQRDSPAAGAQDDRETGDVEERQAGQPAVARSRGQDGGPGVGAGDVVAVRQDGRARPSGGAGREDDRGRSVEDHVRRRFGSGRPSESAAAHRARRCLPAGMPAAAPSSRARDSLGASVTRTAATATRSCSASSPTHGPAIERQVHPTQSTQRVGDQHGRRVVLEQSCHDHRSGRRAVAVIDPGERPGPSRQVAHHGPQRSRQRGHLSLEGLHRPRPGGGTERQLIGLGVRPGRQPVRDAVRHARRPRRRGIEPPARGRRRCQGPASWARTGGRHG